MINLKNKCGIRFITLPQNVDVSLRSKQGFTLVELIVSMALFIVVIFIVTSAFLTLTTVNERARETRAAMDGLSVALEHMARNIRIGYNYHCFSGGWLNQNNYYPRKNGAVYYPMLPAQECTGGAGGMLFYIPDDAPEGIALAGYFVRPSSFSDPYRIQWRREPNSDGSFTCCSYLTSADIKITNLKFYVTDTESIASGNYNQPRVRIVIQGEAGEGSNIERFSMYTSVTQRIPKE